MARRKSNAASLAATWSLTCEQNDEIRMTKLEIMTNDQMTKRSRSWTSSFGLRHSFVLRNSCFVICLLILATGISLVFAQKRNITEKDLWIMTKSEGRSSKE